MSTKTASSMRDTKYEFALLQQGPNSFYVEYTERKVFGSKPIKLEITDGHVDGQRDMITDEQLARIVDGLRAIEEIIDVEHQRLEDELEIQGLAAPRDKVHALVKLAAETRKELTEHVFALEDAKTKVAQVANVHAQLDNALIEKRAMVETLAEHVEKTAKVLGDQAVAIEGKNTELAAAQYMVNEHTTAAEQLTRELMTKQAAIAQLDAERAIAEEVLANHRAAIAAAQAKAREGFVAEHDAELAAKRAELEQLNAEILHAERMLTLHRKATSERMVITSEDVGELKIGPKKP